MDEVETPQEVQPPTLADIAALLASEREGARADTTEQIATAIAAATQPDRSTVEQINVGGTTVQPAPVVSDIRTSSEVLRGTAVSVAQFQPMERFYRTLPEEQQLWRSEESDHYCAQWIRSQYEKDFATNREAFAKTEEWIGRRFGRADTLEGAGGASGALSAGTAGPLIPRPLEQLILIARANANKMRRFAQSFTMTRQTHTIPTAGAMTAEMDAEASTADQGEPTIASVQVTAQKANVKAVVSLEVLADEAVNLIGAYTTLAGQALGTLEDAQFWSTGNGTPPNISSKIDGTAFVETTSGALGFVDVVGMYYACPQVYRDNAAWYVAADVLQFLTLVVDGNSARQFYSGLGDTAGAITDDTGAIGTLLRRPVFEVPAADGIIMFGDMRSAYVVADRQGITATSSTDFLFDTQRVMWLWTERFDGQDVDAVAVRRAAGITSATNAAS